MNARMPPLATIRADTGAGDSGEELIELGPDDTSLSFLQRVYRSPKQTMSRRLEPDMQIARIRLSDKTSRLHPRHVVPKPTQAYEPKVPD